MKFFLLAAIITLLLSSTVTSLSIPTSELAIRHGAVIEPAGEAPDLEKRRGGGGRGGGGGGGGRSGGGGGGRSGGGGSRPSTTRPVTPIRNSWNRANGHTFFSRPSSNSGGATRGGSGPQPVYGRGQYYGGGATVPYRSGTRSPLGIVPFFLPVAALAIFPGLWLYGAHVYPYHNPYRYVNETSNRNESLPVICLCEQYNECGCDDNNNGTYYESLFNGTQPRNTSIVRVADVNGTQTIVVNGTLPNGTTVADPTSGATALKLTQLSGYWLMCAIVAGAVSAL